MTEHPTRILPDLPEQFLPPPGWTDGSFMHDGRMIAYGHIMPSAPRGTVVILPGRAEFREKYVEVMRGLVARQLAVFVLDWHGQGSALRWLPDLHKDHSEGFHHHVADFNAFIRDVVIPTLDAEGHRDLPLVMLGHSMGSHVGLRYLMTLQQSFAGAVLVAPMLGIHNITDKPEWLLNTLTTALKPLHDFYAPTPWRGAWRNEECTAPGEGPLSGDTLRDAVHRAWFCANPHLQLGAPTWGWVHHALQSCAQIQKSDALAHLNMPILFLTAGNETVVDNAATRRVAARIPGARHAEIPGARHEIMMEQDASRDVFFEYFDNFLPACKIS